MAVSIRIIILEIILLVVVGIAERLLFKIRYHAKSKRVQHLWWLWTVIFWLLTIFNLGCYWPAYPLAIWMVLALILIVLQIAHNHEFIYRRYWPVFWRFSAYYALLVYLGGLIISPWLPLV